MQFASVFFFLSFWACNVPAEQQTSVQSPEGNSAAVGPKISGNFSGTAQTATVVQTQKGEGNPVEAGTADAYEVQFSGKSLPAIPIGCCEAILVNEGDLTGDGLDEISVYQAPPNGCTYRFTTYSFSQKGWQPIIDPFLIPTGCEPLSNEALQERVFKEGDAVYYLETDPDSETGERVKVRAGL